MQRFATRHLPRSTDTVRGHKEENSLGPLASKAFAIFAALWAVATLFHQIAYPARHEGIFRYVLTFAALWLLLRPSSVPRLIALASIQSLFVLYTMPNAVTNHWLFTTFVNATILLALVLVAVRARTFAVDRGELFRTFAPAVRIQVLILYFYAVLHKLNHDFLNPEVSCAVNHYLDIAAAGRLLPQAPWLTPFLIYGTLIVEAAIPLMLCFRRTRVAGVVLGMGFHFLLALNPSHRFYNFSAMIFAVYFLFLPYDFPGRLQELAARFRSGRWFLGHLETGALRRAVQGTIVATMVVLAGAFVLNFQPSRHPAFLDAAGYVSRGLWVVYGGLLILTVLVVAFRRDLVRATDGLTSLRLPRWPLAVVPLLVLLNGFSPYLGLKTETSFSMFSNLRTEGGYWNHLFIPRVVQLTDYQNDLVEIRHTSVPWLQKHASEGMLIPYFELRRITAGDPEMSLTYVRNGELRTLARVGDDPELSQHFPLLPRTLLAFRLVDSSPTGFRCFH